MSKDSCKVVLCTDPFLKSYLKRKGIDAAVFDTILSEEEKIHMLENLDRFSTSWFLDSGKNDYTQYRGISIGASVHDEIMNFFHLLVHFIYILDRVAKPGSKIIFYQSASCLMPGCVQRLIKTCGGKLFTCDYDYPYFSYLKIFRRQISTTYSQIFYTFKGEGGYGVKEKLKGIRPMLEKNFSRFACGLFSPKRERYIYLYVMRNLIHFFKQYLETPEPNYGIIMSHGSLLDAHPDRKARGVVSGLRHIVKLAKKGISIDSLGPSPFYKFYHRYKRQKEYIYLSKNFRIFFNARYYQHFQIGNSLLSEYLSVSFTEFYTANLHKFMKIIDFYHTKFSDKKIGLLLAEHIHPFQAQVMAKYGKICMLVPVNSLLHNQYCSPELFSLTKNFFKVIAFSRYDATRYRKLGFHENDIRLLDIGIGARADKQYKTVKSVKDSKVLILPPHIPSLHTYRYQIDSTYLAGYLYDVLDVLEGLGVSRVKIRPHPGRAGYNHFGYDERDCHRGMLESYGRKWNFEIDFSDQRYDSLAADVDECDFVIGTLTGTILQVLSLGKDFIFYDRSIAPFWGSKDSCIFSEKDGMIKRLRRKEDLYRHLKDYTPLDREVFFKKYFSDMSKNERLFDEIETLYTLND